MNIRPYGFIHFLKVFWLDIKTIQLFEIFCSSDFDNIKRLKQIAHSYHGKKINHILNYSLSEEEETTIISGSFCCG